MLGKEKHSQGKTIYLHNENHQNNTSNHMLFLEIPVLTAMYLEYLCDLLTVVLSDQIC